MNDTRSDLMRAIIASPDDDAPRLVFADWLDENGEEERAEFIRVQIALAKPLCCESITLGMNCIGRTDPAMELRHTVQCPTCKLVDALRMRERDLLTPYNRNVEWFVLPVPSSQWNFRPAIQYSRGFVDTLGCAWEDWYNHADAILSETPLLNADLFLMPAGLYRTRSGPDVRVLNDLDAKAFLEGEWPGINFMVRTERLSPNGLPDWRRQTVEWQWWPAMPDDASGDQR